MLRFSEYHVRPIAIFALGVRAMTTGAPRRPPSLRYRRHAIVVGGGRVAIAVALALHRAAAAAVNPPKAEPFKVESLFTGEDSLNPSIRLLEEQKMKREEAPKSLVPHDLKITMIVRDRDIATSMQHTRLCAPYYPSLQLPDDVEVTSNAEYALMQFCPPSDAPQQQKPKTGTLYAPAAAQQGARAVPIEAIFMCVPFPALFTIFKPKGMLHCFSKALPWKRVFADSPGMVTFTRGIDERMALPHAVIADELSSLEKDAAATEETGAALPFVYTHISGPMQPIELIDGKPTSILATSGPCTTLEGLKQSKAHEARVAKLLDCRLPGQMFFVHRFHTQHRCIHDANSKAMKDVPEASPVPCLHATVLLSALKELYCLLFGVLQTAWSGAGNSPAASSAMGSCTSASGTLQVAFVSECAQLLDAFGLPSSAAYTIGGFGDFAAGCGTSGSGSKSVVESSYSGLSSSVWDKLEAACRRHVCDLHPLYLMGIRMAQGMVGSYFLQLKAKPIQASVPSKYDGSKFEHSATPNAYAQYVNEGVECLIKEAERSLGIGEDEVSPFVVTKACIKALKHERRAHELADIVLRPERAAVTYSKIDLGDNKSRDPHVYRHPMIDVINVVADSVINPTETNLENERKLRLRMPSPPPAMKPLGK